jgi:hypothetical protein
VSVLRGRVEVTNLKTGEKVDVLAGQKAAVSSAGGLAIDGTGKIQPIKKGRPVKPDKRDRTREASLKPSSSSLRADTGYGSASGSVDRGATASVSANVGGASASAGGSVGSDGAVNGGVSASVGSGTSTASVSGQADRSSVSADVGNGAVSARADHGGVSASVGGLSVGIR